MTADSPAEHDPGLAALFALLSTSIPGIPEGLHYPRQLRRIADLAGLPIEPEYDLDAYLADLRKRLYGADTGDTEGASDAGESGDAGDAAGEGEREGAAAAQWGMLCPSPVEADVEPVADLRDGLAAALAEPDGARRAEMLNGMSQQYGLFPAVDDEGRPRVLPTRHDVVSCLAAVLIPAAMLLATAERRERMRTCADLECGTLFLDRTHSARRRYCSAKCTSRASTRRQRERRAGAGAEGRGLGPG
ncbi:CGNR zinc finger domain-containing protein [Sinomonas sp. R1AF57]|uniref:CGNR zinc finger domain-containing protein n=1 Tax=Sinomonas sp. R1AF57 TaxID=2020377 RepID=UPI001ABF12E9|nr:CGNR zinc finger domain-containing protein [Sinomonas sp. R1AF57]